MIFFGIAFTTVYLLAGIIYFGNKKPGYNHVKHSISELGETSSPYERGVGYGLFLVVGLLLLSIGFYLKITSSTDIILHYAYLVISVAIGYIVAVFFPCDVGSPVTGSARQSVHNIGGFVEYAGGAYFILQIGKESENVILTNLAYLVFAGAILLSVSFFFRWRGLIQRVIEGIMFSVMLWLAFFADVLISFEATLK